MRAKSTSTNSGVLTPIFEQYPPKLPINDQNTQKEAQIEIVGAVGAKIANIGGRNRDCWSSRGDQIEIVGAAVPYLPPLEEPP